MDSQVKLQQMLINGQWVDSADGDWINVENPSKKTVFAKVPVSSSLQVDWLSQIELLHNVFDRWNKQFTRKGQYVFI